MKKGLLLFLLLPSVFAFECITYQDCFPKECIGSARFCVEGACVFSQCVDQDERDYELVDTIIKVSGKFMFLTLLVIIIALLFPMLRIHGKSKLIAVLGLIIFIVLFGLYLFRDSGTLFSGSWDSDIADKTVRSVLKEFNMDVEEKLFNPKTASFGKEYKIQNVIHEHNLIALYEPEIAPKGDDSFTINSVQVMITKGKLYDQLSWKIKDMMYILTGSKAREMVNIMLNSSNTSVHIITPAKDNKKPQIKLMLPNTTYVSSNIVAFEITDPDTYANVSTIEVGGIPGFDKFDCYMENYNLKCRFETELSPGENTISIAVADTEGEYSTKTSTFIFDVDPWKMELIYPIDEYVNVAKLNFRATDSESGILALNISGIDSAPSCKAIADGLECDYENLNINQGANFVVVNGYDKAGNFNSFNIEFNYDNTRPTISRTTKGFILSDSSGIKENSLRIDGKKYSLDNCNLIDKQWHCAYTDWIREISVQDMAGNVVKKEYMLER